MYWEQNVTGPRTSTAWQGDGCGTLCKPAGRGVLLKSRRRVLPGRLAGIAVGLPPGAPAEAGLGMFRMCRSSPVFRNLRNEKRPGIPSRGRTESAGFSAVRWKKRADDTEGFHAARCCPGRRFHQSHTGAARSQLAGGGASSRPSLYWEGCCFGQPSPFQARRIGRRRSYRASRFSASME